MANVINWYVNAALDDPVLKSPQPCQRGVHCDYKITDPKTNSLVPGCCRGVHPGEEGNGRRLFPARTMEDGTEQPACVRLTGMAGFYERRRLKMSWGEWCKDKGIPFSPCKPGVAFVPVTVSPIKGKVMDRGSAKVMDRGSAKVMDRGSAYTPDATIRAAMDLCQPYTRERHPMQDHASLGGSTAFGLNPRAFDVMAHEHAERSLDPRMQSRGFLGMPGGAEAARIASGGGSVAAPVPQATQPQAEQRSKIALKNARKRANKKATAAAAAAAAAEGAEAAAAAQPQPYIHSLACLRHSGQRPLAWGPEPEGGCLCAGINATIAHNRAVAAGLRPECQPYEGMSCAYGGSAGCSHCVSEEQREFNLAAEPRGGREYRASPADLDPRMMSRGFLGMPGGAEALRIASGGGCSGCETAQESCCRPPEEDGDRSPRLVSHSGPKCGCDLCTSKRYWESHSADSDLQAERYHVASVAVDDAIAKCCPGSEQGDHTRFTVLMLLHEAENERRRNPLISVRAWSRAMLSLANTDIASTAAEMVGLKCGKSPEEAKAMGTEAAQAVIDADVDMRPLWGHTVDNGPDCNYCDPRSGCDGDHGDEMRDGFIVRKQIPSVMATHSASAMEATTSAAAAVAAVQAAAAAQAARAAAVAAAQPQPPPRLNLSLGTVSKADTQDGETTPEGETPVLAAVSAEEAAASAQEGYMEALN